MNHQRRNELAALQARFATFWAEAEDVLEKLKAAASELSDDIDSVKDDEQAAFDALNEGLQATERGQKMEATVEKLQDIVDYLGTFAEGCGEVLTLPADEVNANFDGAME